MKNNIWLLLGPELGRKNKFFQELKSLITKKNKNIQNFKLFICGFDSVDQICEYISTPSLFESERGIVIKQINVLSVNEARILGQCLQKDVNNSIMLLSDDVKVNRYLDIVDSTQKKIFWSLHEHEYFRYLIKNIQDKGLNLTRDAIDTLQYFVADNLAELDNFLQQIYNFVQQHPTNPIRSEHIESWFTHYKKENAFTLFHAIAKKEYSNAYNDIKVMLESGEKSQSIFGGLLYQLKNALQIMYAKEQGIGFKQACDSLNIRGISRQEPFKLFLEDMSVEIMKEIFMLAINCEAQIRETSFISQEFLISLFLYNVYQLHILKRKQYRRFLRSGKRI